MKFKQEQYDPMLLQGRDLEVIFNAVADAVEEEALTYLETATKSLEGREPDAREKAKLPEYSRSLAQGLGIHLSLHLREIFGEAAGAVDHDELIKAYGDIRAHFEDHYQILNKTLPDEHPEVYKAHVEYHNAVATTLVDKTLDYILNK